MSKLVNMSDGISDGFMIAYVKDGNIHPVILKEQQAEVLDLVIPMAFTDEPVLISPKPMGEAKQLSKEDLQC